MFSKSRRRESRAPNLPPLRFTFGSSSRYAALQLDQKQEGS